MFDRGHVIVDFSTFPLLATPSSSLPFYPDTGILSTYYRHTDSDAWDKNEADILLREAQPTYCKQFRGSRSERYIYVCCHFDNTSGTGSVKDAQARRLVKTCKVTFTRITRYKNPKKEA